MNRFRKEDGLVSNVFMLRCVSNIFQEFPELGTAFLYIKEQVAGPANGIVCDL